MTKPGFGASIVEHLTLVWWFAVVFPALGNKLQRLPLCMRRAGLRLNHPPNEHSGVAMRGACRSISIDFIPTLTPTLLSPDLHTLLTVTHSHQVVLETILNHDDGREERGRRPCCMSPRVLYFRAMLTLSRRLRLMKQTTNTSRLLLAVPPSTML